MMETICEKNVVCVNDNGYAAAVQEVNVIVNRDERHTDSILRKCESLICKYLMYQIIKLNLLASSNQSGSQIILSPPTRDNINQQVCYTY